MVNQRGVVVPEMGIELGGTIYSAVLNWNAYAFFESATGRPLPSLDLAKVGITELLALVHAALIEKHPDLTREDVGRMIGSWNQTYVIERLGQLITAHGPAEADRPLAETETGGQVTGSIGLQPGRSDGTSSG